MRKKAQTSEGTRFLRWCILNHSELKIRLKELEYRQEDFGNVTSSISDSPRGHYEPCGLDSIIFRKSDLEKKFDELLPQVNLAIAAAEYSERLKSYIHEGISIRKYGDMHGLNYRQALKSFDQEIEMAAAWMGLNSRPIEDILDQYRYIPEFLTSKRCL